MVSYKQIIALQTVALQQQQEFNVYQQVRLQVSRKKKLKKIGVDELKKQLKDILKQEKLEEVTDKVEKYMKELKGYNKTKTKQQENEDQKNDSEKDEEGLKYLEAECLAEDWVIRQKYLGSQWVATHLPDRMLVDIQKQGGKAFQVGGCVRDQLINRVHSKGLVSKDLDCVVTGLSPEKVYKIFQQHGYLSVGQKKDQSQDPAFQASHVSRFVFRPRSDNHQSRRPNGNFFIDDIDVSYPKKKYDWKTGLKYDLLERDYLWNSVQLDLQTGRQYEPVKIRDDGDEEDAANWQLKRIDWSADGITSLAVNDIKNKKITVLKQSVFNKPEAVQRCINFKHRFGFKIDKSTKQLMRNRKIQWKKSSGSDNQVAQWASDRVQNTLRKTLKKSESVSSAVEDFHNFGLIESLFREIKTGGEYMKNSDFTFNRSTLQQLKWIDNQGVQDKSDLFPFFLGALVRNEQQIKENSDQVSELLTNRLKLRKEEQALAQFAAKTINLFEDNRKVKLDLDMYRRRLQEIVVKNLIYITNKGHVQSCLIDGTETDGKLNNHTVRHVRTNSIIKMSMERVSIIMDGLQQQFMGRLEPFSLSRCSPILMSPVKAEKANKVSRVTQIRPLIPGIKQFSITFQDLTDIFIGIGQEKWLETVDENMLDVIAIAYQHNLKVGGSNADKKILLRVGFEQLFNELNKATHKKILLDKIIAVWRENIKNICKNRLRQDQTQKKQMVAISKLKDMVFNPVVKVQFEAAGFTSEQPGCHQSYFTQKQNIAKFIKHHENEILRLKEIPQLLVADLQPYDEHPDQVIDPRPSSTEPMDISPPQSPNGSDLKFGDDALSMGSIPIERFKRKNRYVRAPFIQLI